MRMKRIIMVLSVLLPICVGALPAAQAVRMFGFEGGDGYLGVSLRDVTADDVRALYLPREVGVLIQRVEPQSPAQEAGLQEGDVILEYAGIPALSALQFRRLVSETPPGRNVEMKVWRAGGSLPVVAEIGRRERIPPIEVPEGARSFRLPEREWRGEVPPEARIRVHRRGPRLGIEGAALTPQMAEFLGIPGTQGVLVMEVAADSPAEKGGLKAGDVVTAVAGRSVRNPSQLSRYLTPGSVELDVVREGRSFRVGVEVKTDPTEVREAERL